MWRRIQGGLLLAGLLGSIAVYAQSTNSGDIRGTVTDQTGAVIPGVSVAVTDIDKNVTHTFETDGAGLYDTSSIVPDHYTLTFKKEGFQTLVRGPITLGVGIQGISVQMSVGSSRQQVTVHTDVALLETENGAQEQTLTAQTMDALPQVGADWENFIWLQPGAAGTPENSSSSVQPNGGQVAINGNLPFEQYLADGATTSLPMSQNSDVTIFETTAEVKISDSAFSAQYGVGNAVYNQITKGGTDQFHGAGYEYFQNDALDAVPYAFGTNSKVPLLRYNNYGFNIGGPVLRKKMFFFFDYDKTIDNGGASIGFETVPTAALMSGDFSGAGLPTLYDPTTQTIQTTGTYTYTTPSGNYTQTCPCVIRKTFLSEYGKNAIPSAMIDPVAAKIQAYYPKPNTTGQVSSGVAQNNFTYNTPSTNPFIKYFGRLDWDITQSNRLTVSETESDNPATYLNQGICPINCQAGDVSRDNAQISDVWSFSPHLINEIRMGFTDQLNFFTPYTIGQGYPAKLGWQFAKADNFPNTNINNFYELGSQSNSVYKEMVFDPSDVVTMIHGRHVLHFGGEFLINRADSTAWGNIDAGDVNYTGSYTSMNGQTALTIGSATYSSGESYADFLLGQTQSWGAKVTPEFGGRWKTPQLFVQDDWKWTPKLTLNLGLRWEGETGWSEVKGNEAAFDPTVPNPAVGKDGAMWYGFSHANGRTSLQAPKWDIFLPRVGFSWAVKDNTVVRGGFGIYASTWSEDTYGGGMGNAFGSNGNYGDNTNGICPVVQLSGTGAGPDTTDPGCGTGTFNSGSVNASYLTSPTTPDALNGQTVTYNQYHTPVPTNYQWTVGVQHQFAGNYAADLAYVGNHGSNLNFPVDINMVPAAALGPNDASSKPYPWYQAINGSTNNAISNYNALQAQLQKRMSYGLQFGVNYTWSHFLDDQDSSGWGSRGGWQNYQDAYSPSSNYSNSNFDIRNMFKGEVIYQMPFGQGRQFLNGNRILSEVVGGWNVSSSFVLQGGNPVSVTTGCNNSSGDEPGVNCPYTQYANRTGDVKLSGSTKSRLNEWYNLSALSVPAPFTYGDFVRNTVYGPGLTDWNASLGKVFALWPERGVNLEVRGEAFNVFNHASFGQPGNNAIGPGESAQITGTTVGGRSMQLYGKISF
jgi:hypothetical protein